MSQRTPKRPLDTSRSNRRTTGRSASRASAQPKARVSRAQKETMYQRMLYIGLAAAAALIVLVLGVGAFWEYQVKPNQVLATVNGEEITREDYWKYQSVTLYNQARMYETYARQVQDQQQQTQFLQFAAQLDNSRGDVWGSTDVSDATLSQMIEDRLYLAAAETQGVDLSQPVLDQYALNMFAPPDAPLITPIPSPTMIPERAAWATETAEAQQTAMAEQMALMGTPMATPVTSVSPVASPVGSPVASPVTSPEVTPTPDLANSRLTATASYDLFLDEALDEARMDQETYMQTIVKPLVAREAIDAELLSGVPQSGPQVEVQHVMVATEDLANQLHAELTAGGDFNDIANANSLDTVSAPTGGNLGWVTHGELPEALETAAFSMEPGQLSAPIQSPYGWHILKVLGEEEDRAFSQTQYDNAQTDARNTWLEEQRAGAEIKSDLYEPTPEPTAATFLPPSGAPTPIVATPVAAPDLSATPVQGPQIVAPTGSPSASPASSPAVIGPETSATPSATPEATPSN